MEPQDYVPRDAWDQADEERRQRDTEALGQRLRGEREHASGGLPFALGQLLFVVFFLWMVVELFFFLFTQGSRGPVMSLFVGFFGALTPA